MECSFFDDVQAEEIERVGKHPRCLKATISKFYYTSTSLGFLLIVFGLIG